MTLSTPNAVTGLVAAPHSSLVPAQDQSSGQNGRSPRVMPLMRKVEIAHLSQSHPGDIDEFTRIVPAMGAFDEAFSAFARGTLIPTGRGLVAVEDLWPGDRVKTADAGFQPLIWRGSTVITGLAHGQEAGMGTLTRIAADALGIARPMPDLILGPRAYLSHRAAGVKRLTGTEAALVPARDFLDGVNIVELSPPTAVQVYNFGFAAQHRMVVHGVEMASMHPGALHLVPLRGEMMSLFLSCFPHIQTLKDFGAPALPRLRLGDLDLFEVA